MIHRKGDTFRRCHLKKVYRQGPRYFVGLLETPTGREVVLKTLLQTKNTWARDALTKEIAFYRWIQDYADGTVSSAFARLLSFEARGRHLWRAQENLSGEFQNREPSQFLLRPGFERRVDPAKLSDFLIHLQRATPHAPPSVKRWFKASPLKEYEHFISWWKAPRALVGESLRRKVGDFLESYRALYDQSEKVLTHFEFYGAHLLVTPQKRIKIIDWENVGLSDRTHDLATLWLRAYHYPRWQDMFLSSFRKDCPEGFPFEKIFAVEAVLQALGNIRFFARTKNPGEVKERSRALDFYLTTVKSFVG